jgi:hypothetical protein
MNPGLGNVLGKNISLIGEPLVTLLYGIDPATGQKVDIKNGGDFLNQFIGSNIPQVKMFGTLADQSIPEDEKFAVRFKALVGLGLAQPQNGKNAKNAENQFNKRTADFIDRILNQEGIPPKGSMLYERLTKVVQNKAEEEK